VRARASDYTSTIVPRELSHPVRVWVYRFLLQLVEGGATDKEVREAARSSPRQQLWGISPVASPARSR
jgi:hypothetical protein